MSETPVSEIVDDGAVAYPGARAPDRVYRVDAYGVQIAVHEWGDAAAPPVMLVHGGFDFARTFDAFAPLLAEAGWRVVAWDQRGHGDSGYAALYTWSADVRDAVAVMDAISEEALPVVGHSKGGSMMLDLATTLPHRVSKVVALDGVPSRRNWPDVPDHQRTKLLAGELATWLDVRRSTVDAIRKPGTVDELAERRGRMNPRLTKDWLRYLVSVGARHDPDGWRWKIDPTMRLGGFGPWRPEWAMERLSVLEMPVLAVLAGQPEPMGWGTQASDIEPHLPPSGRVEELPEVGHFVHIEQPERIAAMVLEFLGLAGQSASVRSRAPTTTVRHNRIDLALHRLRDGEGRPLLHLHGLGEQSPAAVPDHLAAWPGPIWALDFTGHGASTVPQGGGYFAEILMGDADAALAHLGEATIYGRGLGAYVALLIAGARSETVRGAILDDGPGLHGGSPGPASSFILTQPFAASAGSGSPPAPDPYALLELSRDIRPPDYATTFARLAATMSGLEVALAVVGAVRPPWLEAVAREPGVQVLPRSRAVALFAGV